jgi:hypothetical protein
MPFLLAALAFLLAACIPSLSPEVQSSVIDYHEAETNAANQMLLINILRTKDGLPIQFADLINIHGSLQLSEQANPMIPWGPLNHATNNRGSLNLTVGAQSSPSFDVNSLDTQSFTYGILSEIDQKVIQSFIDLGIDPRVILLLFYSGMTLPLIDDEGEPIPDEQGHLPIDADGKPQPRRVTIANSPFDKEEIYDPTCKRNGGSCSSSFFEYLHQIDKLPPFRINIYKVLKPVGPHFQLKDERDIRGILASDTTKFVIRPSVEDLPQDPAGIPEWFHVYEISPQAKVALCFPNLNAPKLNAPKLNAPKTAASAVNAARGEAGSVTTASNTIVSYSGSSNEPPGRGKVVDVCSQPEVRQYPEKEPAKHSDDLIQNFNNQIVWKPRSVYGMIKYLGELVAYSEINKRQHGTERCIALANPHETGEHTETLCDDGNILFAVRETISNNDALSIRYNNKEYFVRNLDREHGCYDNRPGQGENNHDAPTKCDHTLEVLSIVGLLLNENKSATDLRVTPSVVLAP